jgi:hypothetical protein
MGGACDTYWGKRGTYRALVSKPDEMRPFGSLRHRWKDNIKTDLKEIGWECVDRIVLAQGRSKWRASVTVIINLGSIR